MKHLAALYIFFTLLSNLSAAQSISCDCKADFDFLNNSVRKAPAYKDNRAGYEAAYEQLKPVAGTTTDAYECFVLLNRLLLALNDNHSRLYGADEGATNEV